MAVGTGIMRAKATRLSDAVDVLVGAASGESGFKRLDVEVRPSPGGGLDIAVAVPSQLAKPVLEFIAALKGKRP